MRVMIVCAVNGHGGPIQSITTVMRHLGGSFEFSVATQVKEPRTQLQEAAGWEIDIPRPRGRDFIRAAWRLLSRRREIASRVDVIHANGLTEICLVAPLLLATRLHAVVWVHNSLHPKPYKVMWPLLWLLKHRIRWLAVSNLASRLIIGGAPALIVPNPSAFHAVGAKTLNTPPNVVYFAGTDRPNKGFDLLPEIVDECEADVNWIVYAERKTSAVSVETDSAWQWLHKESRERVQVRARTTSVELALAEADIILAPSRQESFNRVIAEGLSLGIPFVASDIEPHRDFAVNDAGVVFPLTRPSLAARHIERITSDPELWYKMACRAAELGKTFRPEPITRQVADEWLKAPRA